jgi:hypothetical protein
LSKGEERSTRSASDHLKPEAGELDELGSTMSMAELYDNFDVDDDFLKDIGRVSKYKVL